MRRAFTALFDDRKWMVVVEPSRPRWRETYVLGPFGNVKAWFVARARIARYPYGEVWVIRETSTMMRGSETIWKGVPG